MKYESVLLGEVCRITAGFPFKRCDFFGRGKVIKSGDVKTSGIAMEELSPVSAAAYSDKRVERFLARPGDSVLTLLGPREEIVKVALVERGEAYVNQGVVLLHPGALVDGEFLFYMLRREDFKQYIQDCLGANQNSYVRVKELGGYPLPLPPLKEQKEIVTVLRALDERCAVSRRIAENLSEQADVLYRSWFESFEPFGGQPPRNWKTVALQDLTLLVDRGVIPLYTEKSIYGAVNQKCIRDHRVDLALVRRLRGRPFGQKLLQYGDVLINSTGVGTLGRTAQVLFEPSYLTADSHVTIVRPAKGELVFYLGLWAAAHESDFISMQVGNTTQTELPRESLRSMELYGPDEESLGRFNTIVASLYAYRDAALAELQQLTECKKLLLSRFLEGDLLRTG